MNSSGDCYLESLNVNTEITPEQELERMTGHLGNHTRGETYDGFDQQTFQVAPCVLKLIESAFDAFPHRAEQGIKRDGVRIMLVDPLEGPNPVARLEANVRLPLGTNKPLVTEDIAVGDRVEHGLSRGSFLQMSRDQLIHHRQSTQGRQGDQFVAEIVQVLARTKTILSTARKVALALTSFVAHDRHRLGVQQPLRLLSTPQHEHPLLTQGFDHQPQAPCPPIELALVEQVGKQVQVIRPDIAQKLTLARKGNEVHRQQQRDHLTIAKDRGLAWFPLQQPWPIHQVPIVHQHVHDGQQRHKVYTCGHGSVLLG